MGCSNEASGESRVWNLSRPMGGMECRWGAVGGASARPAHLTG